MKGMKNLDVIAGKYKKGDVIIELMDNSEYSKEIFISEAAEFFRNGENVLVAHSNKSFVLSVEKKLKINKKSKGVFKFIETTAENGIERLISSLISFISYRKQNKNDNIDIVFVDLEGFYFIETTGLLQNLKKYAVKMDVVFILKFDFPNDRTNSRMRKIINLNKKDIDFIYLIRNYGTTIYYNRIYGNNKFSAQKIRVKYELNIKKLKMKTNLKLNERIKSLLQNVEGVVSLLTVISNGKKHLDSILMQISKFYLSINKNVCIMQDKNSEIVDTTIETIKFNVGEFLTIDKILNVIDDEINLRELEVVVLNDICSEYIKMLDYSDTARFTEGIRALAVKNNCLIITAEQSKSTSKDVSLTDFGGSMAKAATSDFIIGVNKYNYKWYHFYKIIINFFLKREKVKVKVLKNRFGDPDIEYHFYETK